VIEQPDWIDFGLETIALRIEVGALKVRQRAADEVGAGDELAAVRWRRDRARRPPPAGPRPDTPTAPAAQRWPYSSLNRQVTKPPHRNGFCAVQAHGILMEVVSICVALFVHAQFDEYGRA
jgi:hypothetical protein